jgi:hypothetical protein
MTTLPTTFCLDPLHPELLVCNACGTTVCTVDRSLPVPCRAVVLLYGSLPDYQAATFAHLPGGNEAYINWDWMFLAGLPAYIKLKFAPGKPSRVVVVYAPANCDSTTLTCLKTLTDRGVAPGQITTFGFSSTAGNNFIFDRYGFFGMTRELLNQTQQYNWKPNAFNIG